MTTERKEVLFREAENFFEMTGGMPGDFSGDDALDMLVGTLCLPEYGGSTATREILSIIGATPDEIEELIAENIDIYF